MALSDYLPVSGDSFGIGAGHVYLKPHGTFQPFVWGGECMRLDDGTLNTGAVTITAKQDVRGGLKRDSIRVGMPGEASGTLVMKRVQANRMKTVLLNCFWIIDKRVHCGEGIDRDAWNQWEEITRVCAAKFTGRTISGTGWDNAQDDAMVNMPYTALVEEDIYRLSGEGYAIT